MLLTSRSRKKRKAQWTPSAKLTVYITTIAVLVILVVIYGQIIGIGGGAVDKDACAQSVRLNSYAKLKVISGFDATKYLVDRNGNAIELQCATEYLEVSGDKPEILQKKIADSMVDCWQMYGEGELEMFDTKDNNYCAICSRLEFKEETQLPGFTKFLMNNQAPGQETTYMEYFQGSGKRCGADMLSEEEIAALVDQSGLNELDTLDTSSPLAVMFIMSKDAYPDVKIPIFEMGKVQTTTAGIAAGVIAGIALCASGVGCLAGGPMLLIVLTTVGTGALGYSIGASCTADYDAYVMLWPYDDIGNLDCTYLESESTPLKIKEI